MQRASAMPSRRSERWDDGCIRDNIERELPGVREDANADCKVALHQPDLEHL
jgi:hypothetical protein